MTQKIIIALLVFSIAGTSCTKLDEKFAGDLTADQVTGGASSGADALLVGV